ncbi:hypothetical protein Nwi_0486 [Nitrobacter winogradskyi Nb-255]|uniref:Uncharacterized protein n=1 Tax=Nitrobacter winogradskyi (strain ATCC 25391 / DSM 10237 / CIP 104748 / NCIMB 11846 / Nb-255) TaxID=323098 RepID=Q3SVD8_NITWN|nr:hypothetical protein Nwi_0486 [Nitrobacter winogradskyi Nb-255]
MRRFVSKRDIVAGELRARMARRKKIGTSKLLMRFSTLARACADQVDSDHALETIVRSHFLAAKRSSTSPENTPTVAAPANRPRRRSLPCVIKGGVVAALSAYFVV